MGLFSSLFKRHDANNTARGNASQNPSGPTPVTRPVPSPEPVPMREAAPASGVPMMSAPASVPPQINAEFTSPIVDFPLPKATKRGNYGDYAFYGLTESMYFQHVLYGMTPTQLNDCITADTSNVRGFAGFDLNDVKHFNAPELGPGAKTNTPIPAFGQLHLMSFAAALASRNLLNNPNVAVWLNVRYTGIDVLGQPCGAAIMVWTNDSDAIELTLVWPESVYVKQPSREFISGRPYWLLPTSNGTGSQATAAKWKLFPGDDQGRIIPDGESLDATLRSSAGLHADAESIHLAVRADTVALLVRSDADFRYPMPGTRESTVWPGGTPVRQVDAWLDGLAARISPLPSGQVVNPQLRQAADSFDKWLQQNQRL